jgi:hypothetical protein
MEPFQVKPLKIGEYCEPRGMIPKESKRKILLRYS